MASKSSVISVLTPGCNIMPCLWTGPTIMPSQRNRCRNVERPGPKRRVRELRFRTTFGYVLLVSKGRPSRVLPTLDVVVIYTTHAFLVVELWDVLGGDCQHNRATECMTTNGTDRAAAAGRRRDYSGEGI